MSYVPPLSLYTPDAEQSWLTALDLDLTSCGTQTLGTDTTFTFGGMTWTKHNSANEVTHAQLTAGTGLTFTPSATSDLIGGTRTFPYLFLPLGQLPGVIDLGWETQVKIWLYVSAANPAANYDNTVLMFGSDLLSSGTPDWYWASFRGYNGSAGSWIRRQEWNLGSSNTGAYGVTLNNTTNNVMNLTVEGLWGPAAHANLSTYSSGWPAADRPMNVIHDPVGAVCDGFAGNPLDPNLLGISIGALRANSGTAFVSTFARLRVDIRS